MILHMSKFNNIFCFKNDNISHSLSSIYALFIIIIFFLQYYLFTIILTKTLYKRERLRG